MTSRSRSRSAKRARCSKVSTPTRGRGIEPSRLACAPRISRRFGWKPFHRSNAWDARCLLSPRMRVPRSMTQELCRRFPARKHWTCGPSGADLSQLAVFAAAPVVTAEAVCFAVLGFLTCNAEAHAGDGVAPGLGNRRAALGTMRQPRTGGGQAALRPAHAVLHCRVDLILYCAVAGPTGSHAATILFKAKVAEALFADT